MVPKDSKLEVVANPWKKFHLPLTSLVSCSNLFNNLCFYISLRVAGRTSRVVDSKRINHMTMITMIDDVLARITVNVRGDVNSDSTLGSVRQPDHGHFTLRPHFLRDGILPR